MNVIKTYKYYDKKRRRLSIYGRIDNHQIHITVIPCSLDEPHFIKSVGDALYQKYLTEPSSVKGATSFTIPIEDNRPIRSFLSWCRQHYRYYKRYVTAVAVDYLYKEGESDSDFEKALYEKLDM